MATERVQVEISVVDEISNEIKAIRGNLEKQFDQIKTKSVETQSAFSRLGSEVKDNLVQSFKQLATGMVAFASITAVKSFLEDSIKAANESAIAQAKLTTALGYSSKALNDQAGALQKTTLFEDDAITAMQGSLAAYIKNEAQIKSITPVILDLAQATGIDLNTAATQVARAFADDTGELGRYKIAVAGAAGSSERLDSIARGLTNTFGGQARAAADASDGSIQMRNEIGNIQEEIGGQLIPIQKEYYNLVLDTLTGWKEIFKWIGLSADDNKAIQQQWEVYESSKKTLQIMVDDHKKALKTLQGDIAELQSKKLPHDLITAEIDRRNAAVTRLEESIKKSVKAQQDLLGTGPSAPTTSGRNGTPNNSTKTTGATAKNEGPTELFSSMRQLDAITDKLKPKNEELLGYMSLSTELMNSGIAADMAWAQSGEEAAAKRVDAINKEIEAKKRSNLAMQTGFMLANQGMATLQDIAKASGANATTMKRLAQGQALINTAQGVTSILAHAGDAGFLSVPAAIAMSVMIGAQGLAQVAMIEKQKFALGGYARPGMALVGEYGPELVRFDRPGQVYNARETRQMVNSSTTNNSTNATFVFNNPDGSVETLKAKVRTGELDGLIDDLRKRGGF
jgi:hypothetical protein